MLELIKILLFLGIGVLLYDVIKSIAKRRRRPKKMNVPSAAQACIDSQTVSARLHRKEYKEHSKLAAKRIQKAKKVGAKFAKITHIALHEDVIEDLRRKGYVVRIGTEDHTFFLVRPHGLPYKSNYTLISWEGAVRRPGTSAEG